MKNLIGQLIFIIGAGVTAACCLGVPIIIMSLGAIGLSFLIHDAVLIPIFILFLCLTLLFLYRSTQKFHLMKIFYLGFGGALSSVIGLVLLMIGVTPIAWLIYLGLLILLISSIWNFFMNRKISHASNTILESIITCPKCGFKKQETMPTNSCEYFYTCTQCGERLKPFKGDCCVFCSYGSVKCPSKQGK